MTYGILSDLEMDIVIKSDQFEVKCLRVNYKSLRLVVVGMPYQDNK